MKKLLLLLLIISSTAYTQDYSEILRYRGASLGSTSQQQVQKTKEILGYVQKVADSLGTAYEIISLKDRQGNSYPAMLIRASNGSVLNVEAARVSRLLSGLPLVFSPYDLGRAQANAFFDPTGRMIGVPYEFILGNIQASSYIHELYHAMTYQKVLSGQVALWAGVMKVLKGTYLSNVNQSYYYRFVSLDELPATALSLRLDTIRILELKKTLTPQEFNKSRGEAYSLLGEITLAVKAGIGLARQTQSIVERALKAHSQLTMMPLQLGSLGRKLPTQTFSLDSYTWEIGRMVSHANGSDVKFYWHKSPSAQEMLARLQEIYKRSRAAEAAFKQAEKCIYILIEYPDVTKTDFRCLEQTAPVPYSTLDTQY